MLTKQELLIKYSEPTKVLDKGMVRLIDVMGDDAAIVQMARVSYGEGTKSLNDDAGLIRYLMRHYHTSPFEGCVIKIHAKMPILVARQWVRHRTASLNEVSARYSVLPEEFYVPDLDRISYQSINNKQGSGASLPLPQAKIIASEIDDFCKEAYALYEKLIADGVSREIARAVLPVNIYTEWYWVQNLHNLFHFLRLRLHPHAQQEIREFAQAIYDIVQDWVPAAASAFEEYRLGACSFSASEMRALRIWMNQATLNEFALIDPETEDCNDVNLHNLSAEARKAWLESAGLTNKRERIEFWNKIKE